MSKLSLFQPARKRTVLPPIPLLIHEQSEAFFKA